LGRKICQGLPSPLKAMRWAERRTRGSSEKWGGDRAERNEGEY
jgi:hypothetical protein